VGQRVLNLRRCAINRRILSILTCLAGWLLLGLLLSACGGGGEDDNPVAAQRATAVPPTATPRSTALPDVPPAPELGQPERPLTLFFVPEGSRRAATDAADSLADYLGDELGLAVEVRLASDQSQALDAVCSGAPAAAWLDAFTAASAVERCGAEPVLTITRGRGSDATIGTSAELVTRTGIPSVRELAGRPFCRVEGEELTSWIAPGLILEAQGLDPFTDLGPIYTYPDAEEMIGALYRGECSAAAFVPDVFADLQNNPPRDLENAAGERVASEQLIAALTVLVPAADVSAPEGAWAGYPPNVIPYDILVFPPTSAIPAALRDQLVTSLEDFAGERDGQELLREVLDASGLLRLDAAAFEGFRAQVVQAGWDMAYTP